MTNRNAIGYYEIKRGENGWTEATVNLNGGRKETYKYFNSTEEAEKWVYAKIRYALGAEIANAACNSRAAQ